MNLTVESAIGQVFEQFRDVFIGSNGNTVLVYVMVKNPNRDIAYRVQGCRERLCDLLPHVHTDIQILDPKHRDPDELAGLIDATRVTFHSRWAGDEYDNDHGRGHYVDLDFLD